MSKKAKKDPHVFRQAGKRWIKLMVRDWAGDKIFIIETDGSIVELERIKLHTDRVVSDDRGVMYYAPDAKKREAAKAQEEAEAARAAKFERARRAEEAANAAEDAEAEAYMKAYVKIRRDWYVYTHGIIIVDKDSRDYKHDWIKLKVRNWTKQRLFVEEDGEIVRLDRDELRNSGVAWDRYGSTYYTVEAKAREEARKAEEVRKAGEVRKAADAQKQAERQRMFEEERIRSRLHIDGLKAWIFAMEQAEREADAILGLPAGASAAEINSAYKRLAKLHHPDKGGDAAVFIRLGEAKDRALKRVRVLA